MGKARRPTGKKKAEPVPLKKESSDEEAEDYVVPPIEVTERVQVVEGASAWAAHKNLGVIQSLSKDRYSRSFLAYDADSKVCVVRKIIDATN